MSKFNFIYAEDLSHREKTVYIYPPGSCGRLRRLLAGDQDHRR